MPLRHVTRWSGLLLERALRLRRAVALVAIESKLLAQDVLERELGALALAPEVAVDLLALLAALERLDAETDAALARVDVGDLGLDVVADVEELRRLVDALGRELADVDQPLEALLELDEDAEVGDAGDRRRVTRPPTG